MFWQKWAVIHFSKFIGPRQEKAICKGPQGLYDEEIIWKPSFCYIIAHMLKDLLVKGKKKKALVIDIGDASKFRAVV